MSVLDDGMLAAGEPGAVTPPVGESAAAFRAASPPAPAASVPDNGLSAGGSLLPPEDATASSGRRRESEANVASPGKADPRPPAERPYQPDWKKGSK